MGCEYFSDEELACRCCGCLPQQGMNPRLLEVLDAIRVEVGGPVELSSAYRCPEHNAAVGGVPGSLHVEGSAADILLPEGFTVDGLARLAAECGGKGIGRYHTGGFVHVDIRAEEAGWEE